MTKKGIALTDLQMDWLRDNYATMTNAELAEALGVSPRSVGRYGKILGLKKDADLLRLESLRHLEIARRTPKEPSRMSAGHAKASRTMRQTWERERKRAACGLAQKTGLKAKRVPDWLYRQRSRLRRRGYRCMPDSRTAVITVHTQRLPELERMLEKRYQWRFINENIEKMKGYLIVIPYLPIAAQGKELRYAVAGWRKHFREDYHIVIVGDGVKHLSKDPFFARPDVTVLTSRRVEGTPGNYRQHLDYVSCLKKVHEAFPDTDGFVMVADDCYAVRDFHFRDIVWPMCNAQDFCGDDQSNGWARDMWKTKQLLVREGLPHVNYTTHLPQWYSWTRLEQIWKRYDMEHNSYVMENIYYNVYQSPIPPELLNNETDTIRLGVWRAGLTMSEFRAKTENKIWVVNSVEGFSLTLQDFLEEHMKEELR